MERSWNRSIEEICKDIGEKSQSYKWLLDKNAAVYAKRHLFLRFSVLIAALISSFFTVIVSAKLIDDYVWLGIIRAFLEVIVIGVLSEMRDVLDYQSISVRSRRYASYFGNIHLRVLETLSYDRKGRDDSHFFVQTISRDYAKYTGKCPMINYKILHEYITKFGGNKLSKPTVVDELQSIIVHHNGNNSPSQVVLNGSQNQNQIVEEVTDSCHQQNENKQ